jgi:hypothetical protein
MISVKDFVSDVLFQIAEGITEANVRISKANIDMEIASNLALHPEGRGDTIRIDFDILLSAFENKESDLSGKVETGGQGAFKLWVLQGNVEANAGIGGEIKREQGNVSSHRIQFSLLAKIGAKQTRNEKLQRGASTQAIIDE